MFPATKDTLLGNLCIQVTADILSHHMAGLVYFILSSPTACSMTSDSRKIPSNSRSEMVMDPYLFVFVHNSCLTLSGHLQYNTKGVNFCSPLNKTPPTPHPEASTRP